MLEGPDVPDPTAVEDTAESAPASLHIAMQQEIPDVALEDDEALLADLAAIIDAAGEHGQIANSAVTNAWFDITTEDAVGMFIWLAYIYGCVCVCVYMCM